MGYSPWGRKESDTTERLELSHSCSDGLIAKSCLTLVTPMDCSLPGSLPMTAYSDVDDCVVVGTIDSKRELKRSKWDGNDKKFSFTQAAV